MTFITSLFGGESNSLFTAVIALSIVLILVVVALVSLRLILDRLGGFYEALAWQSHQVYDLSLSAIKQGASVRVREVEVRNLSGKRVAGLIISLSAKPTSIYSNTNLEEINTIGSNAGYCLKSPYLNPYERLILRIASVDGDPAQILRVVADNVRGKAVDFSKESINWGIVATTLICITLAFLVGVKSA